MSSTPIKSCKKYVLSYKDSSNNTHQVGFYARDAYDCLMLAREFNSYVHDHPRYVVRIQQKFWGTYEFIKITIPIQDKNIRDLDNAKGYSTLADIMKEQGISTDLSDYWDKEREFNPSNPNKLFGILRLVSLKEIKA